MYFKIFTMKNYKNKGYFFIYAAIWLFSITKQLSEGQNILDKLNASVTSESGKELALNNLKLSGIDPTIFKGMFHVELINLRKNLLTKVPDFSDAKYCLQTLYLGGNNIAEVSPISFTGFYALQQLGMGSNLLTTFPNIGPVKENITFLRLDGNRITSIEDQHLTGWVSLTELNLSDNLLITFPNLGPVKDSLLKLDLSKNIISKIYPSALVDFDVDKLTKLNLKKNSLICDCLMIHVKQKVIKQANNFICELPGKLKGSTIEKITLQDLTCSALHRTKESQQIKLEKIPNSYISSPAVVQRAEVRSAAQCASLCVRTDGCYYFNLWRHHTTSLIKCDITNVWQEPLTGLSFNDTGDRGWSIYSVA